ncbi:MAG: MarR family transcriptional regulator [Clostridia bacterium]|nr:MarR family transcriptional regulator [Clostridia bacterium]
MDQMMSERPPEGRETGFEAFNALLGNTMKSLEHLKAKGMGEYGLSGMHTLCIRNLYEHPEGLTRTELSRRCGVDRAQITRVIGELLAKGVVFEQESGSNYRKKCVLTEEGRKTASEIDALIKKINSFVSGEIEPERLQIFYETLHEICQNLKRAEEFL